LLIIEGFSESSVTSLQEIEYASHAAKIVQLAAIEGDNRRGRPDQEGQRLKNFRDALEHPLDRPTQPSPDELKKYLKYKGELPKGDKTRTALAEDYVTTLTKERIQEIKNDKKGLHGKPARKSLTQSTGYNLNKNVQEILEIGKDIAHEQLPKNFDIEKAKNGEYGFKGSMEDAFDRQIKDLGDWSKREGIQVTAKDPIGKPFSDRFPATVKPAPETPASAEPAPPVSEHDRNIEIQKLKREKAWLDGTNHTDQDLEKAVNRAAEIEKRLHELESPRHDGPSANGNNAALTHETVSGEKESGKRGAGVGRILAMRPNAGLGKNSDVPIDHSPSRADEEASQRRLDKINQHSQLRRTPRSREESAGQPRVSTDFVPSATVKSVPGALKGPRFSGIANSSTAKGAATGASAAGTGLALYGLYEQLKPGGSLEKDIRSGNSNQANAAGASATLNVAALATGLSDATGVATLPLAVLATKSEYDAAKEAVDGHRAARVGGSLVGAVLTGAGVGALGNAEFGAPGAIAGTVVGGVTGAFTVGPWADSAFGNYLQTKFEKERQSEVNALLKQNEKLQPKPLPTDPKAQEHLQTLGQKYADAQAKFVEAYNKSGGLKTWDDINTVSAARADLEKVTREISKAANKASVKARDAMAPYANASHDAGWKADAEIGRQVFSTAENELQRQTNVKKLEGLATEMAGDVAKINKSAKELRDLEQKATQQTENANSLVKLSADVRSGSSEVVHPLEKEALKQLSGRKEVHLPTISPDLLNVGLTPSQPSPPTSSATGSPRTPSSAPTGTATPSTVTPPPTAPPATPSTPITPTTSATPTSNMASSTTPPVPTGTKSTTTTLTQPAPMAPTPPVKTPASGGAAPTLLAPTLSTPLAPVSPQPSAPAAAPGSPPVPTSKKVNSPASGSTSTGTGSISTNSPLSSRPQPSSDPRNQEKELKHGVDTPAPAPSSSSSPTPTPTAASSPPVNTNSLPTAPNGPRYKGPNSLLVGIPSNPHDPPSPSPSPHTTTTQDNKDPKNKDVKKQPSMNA